MALLPATRFFMRTQKAVESEIFKQYGSQITSGGLLLTVGFKFGAGVEADRTKATGRGGHLLTAGGPVAAQRL
jgi:hypothetical protein